MSGKFLGPEHSGLEGLMATTRDVLRRKRQEEAWSAHMERIRAAEARGEPWPEWRPEEGVGVAGGAMPPGELRSSTVFGGKLMVETTEGTFVQGAEGWVRV